MRRGSDEGQAATELALVLPLVAALLLAAIQVTLVARAQILVVHAAREAAREAAVDRRPAAVRAATLRSGDLDDGRLSVEVEAPQGRPEVVRVRVAYRAPTDVAIVGLLVPDVTLTAGASMRVEGPP